MRCPFCNFEDTRVVDSRLADEGSAVRRRRECPECSARFTTFERVEMSMPTVVKSDGRREPFDEQKLLQGLFRALSKRPVETGQIHSAARRIQKRLRELGEREVPARQIGEYVMDALRGLDPVAYVRFASVYRRFEDIEAFNAEIERMRLAAGDTEKQLSLLPEGKGKP